MAEPGGGGGRRTAARARTALSRAAALILAAAACARDAAPDLEQGYALQRERTRQRIAAGARVSGYKAAFTSPAAQRAFGIATPVYAPLFEEMRVEPGGAIRARDYTALRAEVEVAFRLGRDLTAPFDPSALRAAVRSIHVALDLADLRLPGLPGAGAVIADGAGARHYALGPARGIDEVDPAGLTCELLVDAVLFTRAPGSDALGDPWRSLAWLAREHLRRGGRLEAGQVILTGALGRIWEVGELPPRQIAGRCPGLGEVWVRVE